jgi:Fe2+ transport system protein FeoA
VVSSGSDEDPIEIDLDGSTVSLDLVEATKVQVEAESREKRR